MAQIPYSTNRSRMPNVPNVRIGGTVTADDMGARGAKEWQRLGDASNRAANALQSWQIQQDHEREKNNSSNALLVYQETMDKKKQELSQLQGDAIYSAEEELEKFSARAAEEALGTLKNPLGKDLFNEGRKLYDYRNRVAMSRHTMDQHRVNVETSLNASKERAVMDSAAEPGTVTQQIQKGFEINQELYGKYGKEKLDLENIKTADLMVTKAAESLAANPNAGPAEVLKMLADDDVIKHLPKHTVEALRGKYKQAEDLEIDIAWARNLADMDVSPSEVMAMAYKEHKDNPARAKMIADMHSQFALDKANAQKTQAVQAKSDVWAEFAKTNYDITKIPEAIRIHHHDVYMSMVDYSKKMATMGEKGAVPNLMELDNIHSKRPSVLRNWLYNTDNYESMMLYAMGDTTETNRILEKSRMSDAEWDAKQAKQAKAGGGSSSSSGGGSAEAKFDFKRAFERNFTAFTQNQGWTSNTEYSSKNTDHTRFENNAWDEWRRRMADVENYPGQSSLSRPEDVLYGIIRDVNAGKLDLNKPTYDAAMREELAAAGSTVSVTREQLSPEQARWNNGENSFLLRDPDSGEIFAFGDLDARDTRNIHQNIAAYNPDRLIRAYTGGDMNGLGVEEGDYLAIKNGFTNIFDQYGNWKGGRRAPTLAALGQPEEPMSPEPAKSSEMKRMEKEDGFTFTWKNGVWLGVSADKGVSKIVDANGRVVRHSMRPYHSIENPLDEQIAYEETKLKEYEERLARVDSSGGFGNLKKIDFGRDVEQQRKIVESLKAERDNL